MPLPLPNLDDRTYADLRREAIARIPAHDPGWTNYNESDPGIVLVELFAWLAEMLNYRINQVPDASYRVFLALLCGAEAPDAPPAGLLPPDLDAAICEAVLQLRQPARAASPADYEHLATAVWPLSDAARALPGAAVVRRARCVPDWDLTGGAARPAPGHVSLVVVPDAPPGAPLDDLCRGLRDWLAPLSLVGTRLHIVGPGFVPVAVGGRIVLRDDYAPSRGGRAAGFVDSRAVAQEVRRHATAALQAYASPLTGGADGAGWPMGRDVYRSEIYRVLAALPGVDRVVVGDLAAADDPGRAERDAGGVFAVRLAPHELPELTLAPTFDVSIAGGGEGGAG